MKRTLFSLSIIALLAFAGGCGPKDECTVCTPYCDDSGCYNCDGSGCWLVDNLPCESELECAVGEVCTEYGCARPCSFDSDCGLAERCLPEGFCGPADDIATPCELDEDCGLGMICEENICVEGCTSDAECGEGFVCASCGRCQPADNPTCGEYVPYCTENAECGAGRVCTDLGKCADQCDMVEPVCPHGLTCVDSVCSSDVPPADPECPGAADGECVGLPHCPDLLACTCINQMCQPHCDTADDCFSGQICVTGQCIANYRPEE